MPRQKNPTLTPGAAPAAQQWSRPGGISATDPYAPASVAVYRVYNVPDALLYVGLSDNPKRRFQQHAAQKAWWTQVSSWTVTWHPDRETALVEEAKAIRGETPAFNIAGIPEEVDKAKNRDAFLGALALGQPTAEELNGFFRMMMKRKSLPQWPQPRTKLGSKDAEEIYLLARERATAWQLRRHRRYIQKWNEDQERSWFAFAPPAQRPSA